MKSNYENDKLKEELFSEWLDKYFYDILSKKSLIMGWHRVNGEKLQKKGQDTIVVTTTGNEKIIDEKTTLNYINENIPTFAFEIKNTTSGKKGWLFDETLVTEFYLLNWPFGKENPENLTDFSASDTMLISKVDIIKYLQDIGITLDVIEEGVKDLSNTDASSIILRNGIKLMLSRGIYEKPINLVINRTILEKICIFSTTVNVNNVKIFECPNCFGNLIVKTGIHGEFLGCENYKTTGCKGNYSLNELKRKFN